MPTSDASQITQRTIVFLLYYSCYTYVTLEYLNTQEVQLNYYWLTLEPYSYSLRSVFEFVKRKIIGFLEILDRRMNHRFPVVLVATQADVMIFLYHIFEDLADRLHVIRGEMRCGVDL